MTIKEWQDEVHQTAVDHGWHDDPRSFGEIVALCHSELSEALEEYRSGRYLVYFVDANGNPNPNIEEWNGEKLEGIAVEMADCIIRIFDWAGANDVDLEKIIELKNKFNKTRPYKHGNKVI